MTSIRFQCPHCGGNLEVDEQGAGMQVDCPHCSRLITVPSRPRSSVNLTLSEGMRWMVYGKDVIMPKTGKPMREFFESKEQARDVAVVLSSKGRLGLYACNQGTLESFELVEEYEGGRKVIPGITRPDPDYAAPR